MNQYAELFLEHAAALERAAAEHEEAGLFVRASELRIAASEQRLRAYEVDQMERPAFRLDELGNGWVDLGCGDVEDVLDRLPAGDWTVIRDDDAATVGAPCWVAKQAPSEQAEQEHEDQGGTVDDQCPDLRALVAEFHAIDRGWGDWQRDLALTGQSADGELDL